MDALSVGDPVKVSERGRESSRRRRKRRRKDKRQQTIRKQRGKRANVCTRRIERATIGQLSVVYRPGTF